MWFEVQTYRPGLMAYSVKLFLEEQGILKKVELPFDAYCDPDPNKPPEEEANKELKENSNAPRDQSDDGGINQAVDRDENGKSDTQLHGEADDNVDAKEDTADGNRDGGAN